MDSVRPEYIVPEVSIITLCVQSPILEASIDGYANESPVMGYEIGDDED